MLHNLLIVLLFVGSSFAVPKPQQDARIPIEIPIEDPLLIEYLELIFDDPEDTSTGMISASNVKLIGLSALGGEANPQLGVGQLKLNLDIRLTFADLQEGNYYTNATFVDAAGETLAFSGEGDVRGLLHELRVVADANITSLIFTSITGLDLDIVFDHATVFAGGLNFNGEPVNWEELNENFKEVFDTTWAANKLTITETIRVALSNLVRDCSLIDLIGIISGGSTDCLNTGDGKSKLKLRL